MPDDRLSYKISYRRNLPHIQPPGSSLFVTFRLAGSLPASVLHALQAKAREQEVILSAIENPDERAHALYLAQRQHFGRFDHALDTNRTGPHWLSNPAAAQVVADSMHHLDGQRYLLDSYCIMSNHVHMLFTPLEQAAGRYHSLSKIMHSIKGYSAVHANPILGREGQLWQHESYDHIVRDEEEFLRIRAYILDNPVKAGLVEHWSEWPFTYCRLADHQP